MTAQEWLTADYHDITPEETRELIKELQFQVHKYIGLWDKQCQITAAQEKEITTHENILKELRGIIDAYV